MKPPKPLWARRPEILLGGAGVFLLAVAVAAWLAMTPRESPGLSPVQSQAAVAVPAPTPAVVQSMMDIAAEYEAVQLRADQASREIESIIARVRQAGGSLPLTFGPNLTDQQRTQLAELIKKENPGVRSLLQELVAKDQELRELRNSIDRLSLSVPDHIVAREGDRHRQVAVDYLLKKGVSAERASTLVSQVNLQDKLLPGFNVWAYFTDGHFGTWVSQGTASESPQDLQVRAARALQVERSDALKTAARLKTDAMEAEVKQRRAEELSAAAIAETAALMSVAEASQARVEGYENSARYAVGSKKHFMALKVIDKRLRLLALDRTPLATLDVRYANEIAVDGSVYALKEIKKITLVPDVYSRGVDWQAEVDGAMARVTLMKPEKFKSTQFFVVLE